MKLLTYALKIKDSNFFWYPETEEFKEPGNAGPPSWTPGTAISAQAMLADLAGKGLKIDKVPVRLEIGNPWKT